MTGPRTERPRGPFVGAAHGTPAPLTLGVRRATAEPEDKCSYESQHADRYSGPRLLHRDREGRQAGRRRCRRPVRRQHGAGHRGRPPRRAKESQDFFPLTVEYRERAYAGGRIPGGYFKREGAPVKKETLTCRLIDRPIRPLFPDGFRNEVQVICLVISGDPSNDPDVLAINGASAALCLSGIPFAGPVGAVRVGLVDGQFVANPTTAQQEASQLELVVAGTEDGVLMVEAGAKEVSEDKMLEAIAFGHEQCKQLARMQKELVAQGRQAALDLRSDRRPRPGAGRARARAGRAQAGGGAGDPREARARRGRAPRVRRGVDGGRRRGRPRRARCVRPSRRPRAPKCAA